MPLYQQIIATMPKYSTVNLVNLFKQHARIVIEHGGVVRGIEHHGIRPLSEKTRRWSLCCILHSVTHHLWLNRKYATSDGSRSTLHARYHTVTMDVSPAGLEAVDRVIRIDEGVLKLHTFKLRGAVGRVHAKNYKNPYHQYVDTPSLGHWREEANNTYCRQLIEPFLECQVFASNFTIWSHSVVKY